MVSSAGGEAGIRRRLHADFSQHLRSSSTLCDGLDAALCTAQGPKFASHGASKQ